MASGERPGQGSRLRARSGSAAVPIVRSRRGDRLELGRVAPSARSLAVGLALAAAAGLVYLAAVTTDLFAVRTVDVTGVRGPVASDVRAAVASSRGSSLVTLDVADVRRRVEALPTVAVATVDRAFPRGLAITVVPERPAAVLRRGADSWLVSARGRVMGPLARGARPSLPRVWLGRGAGPAVGETLGGDAAAAVRAVAPLAGSGLGLRVASALAAREELTLLLRSGLEVRLGDGSQLPLKLAVAASVAPQLDETFAYLDVAVPERPVAGTDENAQAVVETQPSTDP